MYAQRAWGGNAQIGQLYLITSDEDLKRVGNCWYQGRLKVGDLVVPIRHSGDCFYEYLALSVDDYSNRPGLEIQQTAQFSAYQIGERVQGDLTEEQFGLLLARQKVTTDFKAIVPPQPIKKVPWFAYTHPVTGNTGVNVFPTRHGVYCMSWDTEHVHVGFYPLESQRREIQNVFSLQNAKDVEDIYEKIDRAVREHEVKLERR